MKEKILTFIVNKDKELLLLKGSPDDPQYHKSFWYVVTGACEQEDFDRIQTVKREVKEETNLDIVETIYLNKFFKYKSLGKDCIEYVYISKVSDGDIKLNEEHIEYKWCAFDEFIKLIYWSEGKKDLIQLLKPYI